VFDFSIYDVMLLTLAAVTASFGGMISAWYVYLKLRSLITTKLSKK